MNALAEAGAALLGRALQAWQPLSGGDLSQVIRIELADGRCAVVKNGPDPVAEGEMLQAIRAGGAPAPEVLASSRNALVLGWIEGGDPASAAWADLGRVLRQLHAQTAEHRHYGWPRDFAFGRVPIPNQTCKDWPEFWSQRRLLPMLPQLSGRMAGRLETLCRDLPNRIPRQPRPSLLHGDLWTGNVMARDRQVVALIDPACYYGDREVDVAMLQLFGSPDSDFFAHYGALDKGAGPRLAIYRLWPALVHVALFGRGYLGLVEEQLGLAGV